jgi:hypothetical protein
VRLIETARIIEHLSQIVINSGFRMRPDQRIVRELPLTELWDETGALPGERIRHLEGNVIRGLMGLPTVGRSWIGSRCRNGLSSGRRLGLRLPTP